jgi:NADP-dependent 3-hydroxy acid dehydrogenase YdfG
MRRSIMNLKGKTVLITGASAGIGKAAAYAFAKEGCNLIVTGRRENILASLKQQLENEFNIKVLPLIFDVSDFESCNRAVNSLPDEFKKIDILINNAGLAKGMAKLHEVDIEKIEKVIDTNIKGLLYMTRLIVPMMVKNNEGHIINLGSTAGHETYAGGNVYCATKHAVRALTDGLRIDLIDTPLRVSEISPGAVETEFSVVRFDGDTEKAKNVYKGFTPLRPEDIADLIVFAATRPPHVQISELIVMPVSQATGSMIYKK